MSEQRVQILIRLLLRSSLIRIYTVCHSFYFFWRHYFIVKLNCFILRITTVAGLGVPIFRVFTVICLLRPLSRTARHEWLNTDLTVVIVTITFSKSNTFQPLSKVNPKI